MVFRTVAQAISELKKLHRYSKDIIKGTIQSTVILYIFGFIVYILAPYAPNYFLCIEYYSAAFENAPVLLVVGVIMGLACDLILRKPGKDDAEEQKKHEPVEIETNDKDLD